MGQTQHATGLSSYNYSLQQPCVQTEATLTLHVGDMFKPVPGRLSWLDAALLRLRDTNVAHNLAHLLAAIHNQHEWQVIGPIPYP